MRQIQFWEKYLLLSGYALSGVINPMTDRFTISDQYYRTERDYLTSVVRESNLPEGITVVPRVRSGESIPAPFLVAAVVGTLEKAIAAYLAGAIKYVVIDHVREKLLSELNAKLG